MVKAAIFLWDRRRKENPVNTKDTYFQDFFTALPTLSGCHAPGSKVHTFLKTTLRAAVVRYFQTVDQTPKSFGPFGDLVFPYQRMGAVDSLNLFDLDELILFSFYWVNRHRYRRVADIGANLGLHAILLSRCGFEVTAYEPDPRHFGILKENLLLNDCQEVKKVNAAVSSVAGVQEFVRVLGNTTGNHLAGSKPHAYGELERFPVEVVPVSSILEDSDLIKMDVEGHERELLLSTRGGDWDHTDALVEVGSLENASAIFEHFSRLGVGLFSQKINWGRVMDLAHMPVSYREGILFISRKDRMPWDE